MSTDWKTRWMRIAHEKASWSKDPSTKVGCVIVRDKQELCAGFNGFPRGVIDDPARYANREEKYKIVVHAEVNAICFAAKQGIRLEGAVAFTTYPVCGGCAGLLLNAGIVAVWTDLDTPVPERFMEAARYGHSLLHEAGVPYNYDPAEAEKKWWDRNAQQRLSLTPSL